MQAGDIGVQWPVWRRLYQSRAGHATEGATPQAAPTPEVSRPATVVYEFKPGPFRVGLSDWLGILG